MQTGGKKQETLCTGNPLTTLRLLRSIRRVCKNMKPKHLQKAAFQHVIGGKRHAHRQPFKQDNTCFHAAEGGKKHKNKRPNNRFGAPTNSAGNLFPPSNRTFPI